MARDPALADDSLPPATATERIRILTRPSAADGRISRLSRHELAEGIGDAGRLVWIDLLYPQGDAAGLLRDDLGIAPLTLEDCLTPLRMPKVDRLPDGGAFVAAFGVRVEEHPEPRLRATEVDLLIGPGTLVTVRHAPCDELDERLQVHLGTTVALPERSGPALAHAAIDTLIDQHLPVMLRTAEVADQLEDDLDPRSERSSIRALEQLIVLRRDLLAFRRLAVAQQEVLRRLGRLAPEVGAYFADVADNEREAVDMADATRDYIDGAIEAYRLRRDERTNVGVRRLTILASIFAPLSLLTALFGVNFQNIPGTDEPWGFPIFVGIQAILAVTAVSIFRRRGLL